MQEPKQESNKEQKKEQKPQPAAKTDAQFISGLTKSGGVKPNEQGMITIEGSFPQVLRTPKIDKTVNGMVRTTY